MTQEQLEKKFLDQAVPCLGEERAERAMEACWELDGVKDMASFVEPFIAP